MHICALDGHITGICIEICTSVCNNCDIARDMGIIVVILVYSGVISVFVVLGCTGIAQGAFRGPLEPPLYPCGGLF